METVDAAKYILCVSTGAIWLHGYYAGICAAKFGELRLTFLLGAMALAFCNGAAILILMRAAQP